MGKRRMPRRKSHVNAQQSADRAAAGKARLIEKRRLADQAARDEKKEKDQ